MIAQKKSLDSGSAFLTSVVQKLDASDEAPLVYAQDDINTQHKPLMDLLIEQKLFSTCAATHIACINCEGRANIRHSGNKGDQHFAGCKVCGANFRISEKEIKEFRTTWAGFAGWVSSIMGFSDKPEAISSNVFFLGHYNHGTIAYEVHLMKNGETDASKHDFQEILQQKTKPVVLICLAKKPKPSLSKDIRTVPLIEFLSYRANGFHLQLPERIFSGVDSVKQRAGLTKVENDPQHQCRERLKEFVRKNIATLFARMMHPDIRQLIEDKHSQHLLYKDKQGNQKTLSKQIILNVVKEVLEDTGQTDYISGRKQPY